MRSVRVLRNVVTNYLRFFLSGAIGFVITPVMVHLMGNGDYGLWVTVFSLTGYFGLFDQGIRPSLVRYISRDHALGDEEGLSRTVNTAVVLFAGVGLVVLAVSAVIAVHFTQWFHLDPARHAELMEVVLVAGASIAVGFPFGVFGAVLSGLQRYDVGNTIGLFITVLRSAAFVLVLHFGGGLLELAWTSLLMSLLGHALCWVSVARLLPNLHYGPRWVTRDHLGLIGSYSSIAFLGALASSLTFQTDSLVITALLGAALVTPFAIAAGLVENVRSLVYSATFVLAPTASEMETRGETESLHAMLIAGSKYSVLVSWPVLFGLFVFGREFIEIWVGPAQSAAYPVLVILCVPTLLALPQSTASALLFGVSRHRGVVVLSLANAILNLGLSLWWAKALGLIGVALGTAVPLALVGGVATMVYACRVLRLPARQYVWRGLVRPGLVSLAFLPPALLAHSLWPMTGWTPLLVSAAASWMVFALVAWRLGVDEDERKLWARMVPGLFGREPSPAETMLAPATGTSWPGGKRAMRVSVVITAYNAAWCIERAIDSVLAGTRLPDEILLADDGSTDDTVARVERRYGKRVRVVRMPHRGLTPTRRASFEAATGDWFAPMDADDEWLPEKLERQMAFIEAHPAVRWCTTDGIYIAAEGVIRESWLSDYFSPLESRTGDMLAPLAQRCFPLVSSMLVERAAYHGVGGFDTAFQYSQDYDLWLRLAAAHPGGILAEPLIRYWASPGQMSRKIEARFRDDYMLMERLASGALRDDPAIRRAGEARATALAFEIALLSLRDGRPGDARKSFARASAFGPAGRRVLSAIGAAIPPEWMSALVASDWLRGYVASARRPQWRVDAGPPPGEAA